MRRVAEAEVTLPNGCWQGGTLHREARVRGLEDGEDLEAELSGELAPIERTTALLARCVSQLAGADANALQDLSMGDREALLLHIRRMTFGDRMDCLLSCPACASRMDFQLHTETLIVPSAADARPQYEEEFLVDGVSLRVKFRVPTGKDVREALASGDAAPDSAVRALIARCLESVRQVDTKEEMPSAKWPTGLATQVAARMTELDPQAEIKLQLQCPACRHAFSVFFDIADFLFRELRDRERRLYQEVHQLALAYHWSEADILRMTARKRKLYLDLLNGGGVYE
jgi:hypothetical protein